MLLVPDKRVAKQKEFILGNSQESKKNSQTPDGHVDVMLQNIHTVGTLVSVFDDSKSHGPILL